jgi:hypothetical protein
MSVAAAGLARGGRTAESVVLASNAHQASAVVSGRGSGVQGRTPLEGGGEVSARAANDARHRLATTHHRGSP